MRKMRYQVALSNQLNNASLLRINIVVTFSVAGSTRYSRAASMPSGSGICEVRRPFGSGVSWFKF